MIADEKRKNPDLQNSYESPPLLRCYRDFMVSDVITQTGKFIKEFYGNPTEDFTEHSRIKAISMAPEAFIGFVKTVITKLCIDNSWKIEFREELKSFSMTIISQSPLKIDDAAISHLTELSQSSKFFFTRNENSVEIVFPSKFKPLIGLRTGEGRELYLAFTIVFQSNRY